MMDLQGKRVLIVGLARSGRAAAHILSRKGAVVTVTDSRPPSSFPKEIPELARQKIGLELGLHREQTFLRQDLIVVSPGVPFDMPQLEAARQQQIAVLPEIEVASWFLQGSLVGITGSNGKTTTTSLLGKMLETSSFPTFVGGNIGVPLISAVEQARGDSMLVTELSSFQLEATQGFRPHVAVLLNLSPNHLDRHHSFEAYVNAKARIFRNQKADDYAILNADDPNVMNLASSIPSRKIFFSRKSNLPDGLFISRGHIVYRVGNLERILLEASDVRLRGDFNLEDVLAASAAACVAGGEFDAIRESVRDFKGVEHRLEFVRQVHRVDFYNDSKATSVDATVKALSAFDKGVHLILGGKDKGAPYTPLRALMKDRVNEVLLIGSAADKIAKDLEGSVEIVRAGDLETAVRKAFDVGLPGDVILLAPACASFDQFQDYEQRGRAFKDIVADIAREATLGIVSKPAREAAPAPPAAAAVEEPPALEIQESAVAEESPAGVLSPEPAPEPEADQVLVKAKSENGVASPEAESPAQEPPMREPERLSPAPREVIAKPDLVYLFETDAEEYAPASDDLPVEKYDDEIAVIDEGSHAAPEPAGEEVLPYEVPAAVRVGEVQLSDRIRGSAGPDAAKSEQASLFGDVEISGKESEG